MASNPERPSNHLFRDPKYFEHLAKIPTGLFRHIIKDTQSRNPIPDNPDQEQEYDIQGEFPGQDLLTILPEAIKVHEKEMEVIRNEINQSPTNPDLTSFKETQARQKQEDHAKIKAIRDAIAAHKKEVITGVAIAGALTGAAVAVGYSWDLKQKWKKSQGIE